MERNNVVGAVKIYGIIKRVFKTLLNKGYLLNILTLFLKKMWYLWKKISNKCLK